MIFYLTNLIYLCRCSDPHITDYTVTFQKSVLTTPKLEDCFREQA